MGRKWRWFRDWAGDFLSSPLTRPLSFYEKGVWVTITSILRTQDFDEPARFVMNGNALTVAQIRQLIKQYAEPSGNLTGTYAEPKPNLAGTYSEPSSEPNAEPKSTRSTDTSEGMKLYHAVKKLIAQGLLKQDTQGVYYAPEVLNALQESERAAKANRPGKRPVGNQHGNQPGTLEVEGSTNGDGNQTGIPIDELPERYKPIPKH